MEQRVLMEREVLKMIDHAFNNYMEFAFPHDELKPMTKTYTDSLGELGNVKGLEGNKGYSGVALTLIDSLSTLAVIGDARKFQAAVTWLTENLSFNVDVRVNVFEANIRLLGGLLSAHLLAENPGHGPKLLPAGAYSGGLLELALDLGKRLLPAFAASPTGLPYAWVNLRHGVFQNETEVETNTAACGSFTIEMGVLSRLTGLSQFQYYAERSLQALWSMRTPLGLFGTALDMHRAVWLDNNGGIGASADSFYEYLLKAYILFGEVEYWDMFQAAYTAAIRHYKDGPWYPHADIWMGAHTHLQFTSLQAFWPGMQVLAGDVKAAAETFAAFFGVWQRFGLLPERYLYGGDGALHPTEQYYPLRPELIESAFYLHQATGEEAYVQAGRQMLESLNRHARVEGGYASVRSVASMEKEDHMHSFFLAETCKYLFLLANNSFWQGGNFVFTTEGHPIPVNHPAMRRSLPQCTAASNASPVELLSQELAVVADSSAGAFMQGPAELTAEREPRREAAAANACSEVGTGAAGGLGAEGVIAEKGLGEGQEQNTRGPGGALEVGPGLPRLQCKGERGVRKRARRLPAEWGTLRGNASALDALVCPDFTQVGTVESTCHIRDGYADGSCGANEDCGVDGTSCRQRRCSEHGFCMPAVVVQHINQPVVIHHVGQQGAHVQGVNLQGMAGKEVMQGFMKIIMQVQQHLQQQLPAASGGCENMQHGTQSP